MTVNGRTVNAVFPDNNIEEFFLPLLRRLTALEKEKGRRVLVMLAAPPAAGKSTLALFLQMLSRQKEGITAAAEQGAMTLFLQSHSRYTEGITAAAEQSDLPLFSQRHVWYTEGISPAVAVGMDGFHRYARELAEMKTVRDGREVTLTEIKGAPVTFDLARLTAAIGRLRTEPVCRWPLYDRSLHDPVEDALLIKEDIVILEGNYLLLDEPGWRDLRHMADYTIRILADEQDLRERLVQRKAASGISREAAERFVEFSDLVNVREVMDHFLPADLTLRMKADGSYEMV